jgi:hypothetical protein
MGLAFATPSAADSTLLRPLFNIGKTMNDPLKKAPARLAVSRRALLLGTAAIVTNCLVASGLSAFAAMPEQDALHARFMRLSSLLVNHRLNPAVGARIVKAAQTQHKDLPAMMDSIIAVAEQKQAKVVEDFFEDIPEGALKDFAHWVVFAWYSGVSAPGRDAELFTFEEALTFQTTLDVVTIPSYGISGPNRWSQTTVALSNMPRF